MFIEMYRIEVNTHSQINTTSEGASLVQRLSVNNVSNNHSGNDDETDADKDVEPVQALILYSFCV